MYFYRLVTHSIGQTKGIKNLPDEICTLKVAVVMPYYKEITEI